MFGTIQEGILKHTDKGWVIDNGTETASLDDIFKTCEGSEVRFTLAKFEDLDSLKALVEGSRTNE